MGKQKHSNQFLSIFVNCLLINKLKIGKMFLLHKSNFSTRSGKKVNENMIDRLREEYETWYIKKNSHELLLLFYCDL